MDFKKYIMYVYKILKQAKILRRRTIEEDANINFWLLCVYTCICGSTHMHIHMYTHIHYIHRYTERLVRLSI